MQTPSVSQASPPAPIAKRPPSVAPPPRSHRPASISQTVVGASRPPRDSEFLTNSRATKPLHASLQFFVPSYEPVRLCPDRISPPTAQIFERAKEPGAKASGLFDPLNINRRIGVRIAARVLHSLRCDDRPCPVSNRGPIAPEANCLLVLQRLNSVVEGDVPASRTRESKNQLFPTNHDPAANPKAPAPDSLSASVSRTVSPRESRPSMLQSSLKPFRTASVSEPLGRAPAQRLFPTRFI